MGASKVPQIGDMLSLTSVSDVRYVGILVSVNVEECTIGLARVLCFGTEGRATNAGGNVVAGSNKLHDHVDFQAADIKELAILGGEDICGARKVHGEESTIINDPCAIVPPELKDASKQNEKKKEAQLTGSSKGSTLSSSATKDPLRFDSVGRSRLQRSQTQSTSRGGCGGRYREGWISGPTTTAFDTDFDFETANQEFQRETMMGAGATSSKATKRIREDGQSSPTGATDARGGEGASEGVHYYNKNVSFFDSISSCDPHTGQAPNWMQSMRINEETFGADALHLTGGMAMSGGPSRHSPATNANSVPTGSSQLLKSQFYTLPMFGMMGSINATPRYYGGGYARNAGGGAIMAGQFGNYSGGGRGGFGAMMVDPFEQRQQEGSSANRNNRKMLLNAQAYAQQMQHSQGGGGDGVNDGKMRSFTPNTRRR